MSPLKSGSVTFHQSRFDRISAEKRGRVLNAAINEFSENGLAQANVNRIAELGGISVGSLYKYFESKEDLYLTVVGLGLGELEAALKPILASDLTVMGKIGAILDALFERTPERSALTRLYNRFTTEGNTALAQRLAVDLETISSNAYSALLTQAKAEGLMDAGADERVFAFCLDNIFLTLQFSLSSEYYRDRMEIYLGQDIVERQAFLKAQVMRFIQNALSGISK